MADAKISALTGATTPLAGTEVLPIVQSGSTVKVSVANLTAGRAVAMAGGSFTDNLTQSTAAKGFNFTANTPTATGTMTSQLLNWYEEGTWTPRVGGTATYTVQSGQYTRIGRQVTIRCDMAINVIGTGSTKYLLGLPFTPAQSSAGALGYFADLNGTYVIINPMVTVSNNIIFETAAAASNVATDETAIFKNGTRVIVTVTYFV
jgi:hypothetical protein